MGKASFYDGFYGFMLDLHVSICLSICHPSIYTLFLDDNLSKYQWIFTKHDMLIDNVELWFGIVYGQILSIFNRV